MSVVTKFDLLRYRRTKIVATVGPATASAEAIGQLIYAGVNVFRINMSHGSHRDHAAAVMAIREQSAERDIHTGILADLCGPKIRTGKFHDGAVEVETGATVTVTTRDVVGDATCIPSQYQALADDVKPGNRILLNDGAVELSVTAVNDGDIQCSVVSGGPVGDHKGINLPGVEVSAPCLTDKDKEDAKFAIAQGVDFIALSFVRTGDDIDTLRSFLGADQTRVLLIAKIEKPEALENSAAIISRADGIMVARGDLGVELNPEQVPTAQQQLIAQTVAASKPVIVATQMLESMIAHARPTRAEVTDISHAVAGATDAVMLSGETAVGAHPIAAVEMMDRVARQTESYHWHRNAAMPMESDERHPGIVPFGRAVAAAAAQLVADVGARAILVISQSGTTAATISAARPGAPVVVISRDRNMCRRMCLMWGVVPHLDVAAGSENPVQVARRVARSLDLAQKGQSIVLVRGFHADPALNTPTLSLLEV